MNTDQESLLADVSTPTHFRIYNATNGNSRWKKNIFLILISFSIAICLTVYFYLNIQAYNENQVDSGPYKPLSRRKPMLDHESIFSDSGPSMIGLSNLLAHCVVALHIAGKEVVNLSLAHNKELAQVGSKGKTKEGADDIVTGVDIKSHRIILNTIKDSYRRLKVVSEEDTTVEFENKSAEDDILPISRVDFAELLRNQLHEIEDNQPAASRSLVAQHETLVWIDPLDATKEYSENLTDYVTLMACIVHNSVPIAGVIFKPFTNQTYWSMIDTKTNKYYHSRDVSEILGNVKTNHEDNRVRIIVSRSHAGQVKNVVKNAYGERAEIISAGGSGYKTIELLKGKADAYVHLTYIKKWDICAPTAILSSLPNGNLTDLDGNLISFGNFKDKVVTTGVAATLSNKLHKELIRLELKTNM